MSIIYRPSKTNQEVQSKRAPLKWHANIEDQASGKGLDKFYFNNLHGNRKSITVSHEITTSPNLLYRELCKNNADLPFYSQGGRRVVPEALKIGPSKNQVAAASTGWLEPEFTFVDAEWISGAIPNSRYKLIPPIYLKEQSTGRTACGDLESWVSNVAAVSCPRSRGHVLKLIAFCPRRQPG